MKKILALLLALVTVLSFAACGGNEEPETTTNSDVEVTGNVNADVDTTTAVEGETTAADTSAESDVTTQPGETTAPDATTDPNATTIPGETTTAADLDVNDKQAVIDYYNAAVKKTDPDKPKGQQSMLLSKNIDGDGAIGLIAKVVTPIAKSVLKNNSSVSDWVPGDGYLKVSDCKSISATVNNGVVTVNIVLKDQVDGSDADGKNGGPVARGIGTLGSIDEALNQMGATFSEGRETVSLTYNKATIKATIDQKTGKITHGTWKYTVDILIKDAKGTISGMSAPLKNITSAVDYSVVI